MEQAFLAPLHQGPSRAGRMMRCPNQSICRTVLFMCGGTYNEAGRGKMNFNLSLPPPPPLPELLIKVWGLP